MWGDSRRDGWDYLHDQIRSLGSSLFVNINTMFFAGVCPYYFYCGQEVLPAALNCTVFIVNVIMHIKRVCVYCGSSSGAKAEYLNAARRLGAELAGRNIGLVYGGGSVGLMGGVSATVHDQGGSVVGIIPKNLLPREISGDTLGELIVTEDMHERKKRMFSVADAFVALPGGFGTLEELLEIMTWHQLGLHEKPICILNVCGFFDSFIQFLDKACEEGFISASARRVLFVGSTTDEILEKILSS